MIRAGFIADVHIDNFDQWGGPLEGGVNRRAQDVIGVLAAALDRVAELNPDAPTFILGDLFHRARPEPALLSRTGGALAVGENGGGTFTLVGNHDRDSGETHHHAIAPLRRFTNVVATAGVICNKLLPAVAIPFYTIQESSAVAHIESVLQRGAAPILLLHMGLADKDTPDFLLSKTGAVDVHELAQVCKKYGVTHVFAGDWHRHQRWHIDGVTLVQVGALAPNRFPPQYEDSTIGPLVLLHDDGSVSVEDIPGPRFYKVHFTPTSTIDPGALSGSPAYVKLMCRTEHEPAAREFADMLREKYGVGGVRLEVDRGVERANTKTATFEARQAATVEAAVEVYISRAVPEKFRSDVSQVVLSALAGKTL